MLYQVATAGLSPADIAAPVRHIFNKQKNVEVLMAEVTGIDVQEQRVHLREDDQTAPYDYLIVATGATNNYFEHEEWQRFAPGLKSLNDGLDIRRKVLLAFEAAERESDAEQRQALLTFVLVGGGPTGVELAGALAELVRNAFAGKHLPGVVPVAIQEGRYVAAVIADRVAGKAHPRPFRYFDKGTLATVGRAFGAVNMGPLRFTGTFAWFTWLFVHLLFLIGLPKRLQVFLQYAWTYLSFQKGDRIVLPEGTSPPVL